MKTNDELRTDVMEEIKSDPQFTEMSSQIGVASHDGVVTLSGLVDSYATKLAAEKAAQRVGGVKVVASEIKVKLGQFNTKTDIEIAEAITNALRWNSAINKDLIEVKVDSGWVTLDGKVDWEYERSSVQRSIENLTGVRGVTNAISIKSKIIDAKEIKHKITTAFHRNASVDASSITIETSGNNVTLRGKVKSWAEKSEAENIAWSSPGVATVDNQIEIDLAVYA